MLSHYQGKFRVSTTISMAQKSTTLMLMCVLLIPLFQSCQKSAEDDKLSRISVLMMESESSFQKGNLDLAEAQLDSALAFMNSSGMQSNYFKIKLLFGRSHILKARGNLGEADSSFSDALFLISDKSISDSLRADVYLQKAILLDELDSISSACNFYLRSLELRERIYPPRSMEVENGLLFLSVCYMRQGNFEAALPLTTRLMNLSVRKYGSQHLSTADAVSMRSTCLVALGLYEEADQLLWEFSMLFGTRENATSRQYREILRNLAYVSRALGKKEQALKFYEQLKEMLHAQGLDSTSEAAKVRKEAESAAAD